MRAGNSVTMLVRSGQTEDGLPPASYQHTPNAARVCVSVQKKKNREGWGREEGGLEE